MRNQPSRIALVVVTAAALFALGACNKEERQQVGKEATKATETAKTAISDTAITAKVKSVLLADADVKGLDIKVDTTNGVVALTGKVSGEAERSKAIQLARGVDGVREVNDALLVN